MVCEGPSRTTNRARSGQAPKGASSHRPQDGPSLVPGARAARANTGSCLCLEIPGLTSGTAAPGATMTHSTSAGRPLATAPQRLPLTPSLPPSLLRVRHLRPHQAPACPGLQVLLLHSHTFAQPFMKPSVNPHLRVTGLVLSSGQSVAHFLQKDPLQKTEDTSGGKPTKPAPDRRVFRTPGRPASSHCTPKSVLT